MVMGRRLMMMMMRFMVRRGVGFEADGDDDISCGRRRGCWAFMG